MPAVAVTGAAPGSAAAPRRTGIKARGTAAVPVALIDAVSLTVVQWLSH